MKTASTLEPQFPQIIGIANQVPLPVLEPTAAADEEKDKLGRLVRRYSGQEAGVWFWWRHFYRRKWCVT